MSTLPKSRGLSEIRLPVTVPQHLAERLREQAERECSSLAATARRLIAVGLARELAHTAPSLAESR